jgi:hypothetical protein
MKFPISIIKDKEAPIYFFNSKTFGLVSKRGEGFYKKGMAYDSDGTIFKINGLESIARAPLVTSIRYVQPMFIVKVKYELVGNINLAQYKKLVIDHIRLHPRFWIKLDLIDSLEISIKNKMSFEEIMNFVR